MTAHKLDFEVSPVKFTCPDIDKVIKWITSAMKMAKDSRKTFPEADDIFHDIYYELEGCDGLLEDLRKANSSLRLWGYELQKEIKEKEEEISTLEGEVEKLQQKITLCQE
jgi:chromosome segregation ATPase